MSNEMTMQVGGRRVRRTRGQWVEEVRRWRESGRSAREYAATHGMSDRTLTWWASRLNAKAEVAGKRSAHAPMFLPVRVSGSEPSVVAPQSSSRGGRDGAEFDVEIELGNGRRVRFRADVAPMQVARLLEAVEGGASC